MWQELLELKKTAEELNYHELFFFHGAGFLDDGTDWEEKIFYLECPDNDKYFSETQLNEFVESNFPSPEQGFLVAISTCNSANLNTEQIGDSSSATKDDLRSHVLALAKKYQQGAIYEFKKNDRNRIIRLTVPVCISGCESQVELEACSLKIFLK